MLIAVNRYFCCFCPGALLCTSLLLFYHLVIEYCEILCSSLSVYQRFVTSLFISFSRNFVNSLNRFIFVCLWDCLGHSRHFESWAFTSLLCFLFSNWLLIYEKPFSFFNQRQHYFFKSLWERLLKAVYVTVSLCSLKVSDFPGSTLSTNATLTHPRCVRFI